MITRIRCDRIITPRGLFDGYVYVDGGKIADITTEKRAADLELDYTGRYLSPGFIEMHTHGAGGHPFLTDDAKTVAAACEHHLMHGTTTILPTTLTAPIEVIEKAVKAIKTARDEGLTRANILGAHLEGPYLSKNQCGAQNTELITPPIEKDYKALVEKYGDAISRWTYAPENDPEGKFAAYLTERGILPSAGHTDAKYEDMAVALDNGCKLVTHLYSATSTVTRKLGFRSLGVIESAFLRDDLYAEIIADGKHLPRELVQMIIKIKGTDKVALVTDSLEIAGTDITEGSMAGVDFIVEDGVCKLRDRSAFAGSIATADRLIRFISKDCEFDICEAVKMMTAVPADLLGINKGKIDTGYDADLVVFDDDVNIEAIFVNGKMI
jgi:N-acetylglucosamine-6-phosphate deacetylase